MTAAVLVVLLALALVAVASGPGDGRSETAVALPLVAVAAVSAPLAVPAVVGGVVVAYASLVAIESRTLLFGRRLRALAAGAGATVPLAVVGIGAAIGRPPAHPELWLAGCVVPGVLAYDLRRQSRDRRTVVAVVSTVALVGIVAVGVALAVLRSGASADPWSVGAAAPTVGVPLGALAAIVLGGLAAGVLARWRYGLHVAPLSVPLLAVWTLETLLVPVAYGTAMGVAWLAQPALRRRTSGRRAAAAGGLIAVPAVVGVLLVAGRGVLDAAGPVFVLAGVLAAEDARLLRAHAGRDRTHAVGVAASSYALLLVGGVAAHSAGTALSRPLLAAAATALAVVGAVVVQRERHRPSEQRLRTEERRWTP